MKIIQGLTDEPNQQINLVIPDGSRALLSLYFRPQQLGWFYDLVWTRTDGSMFPINGNRLVASPNCLRQFQNRLPFGLSCVTLRDIEPMTQTTFTDGTSTLLLLTAAEVQNIDELVFPGL